MNYYKALNTDGVPVDVFNTEFQFVKYAGRNGIFLRCDELDNPHGIIASDNSTIFLVDGWEACEAQGYQTVSLIAIDEEEYSTLYELIEQSKAGEEITWPKEDDAEWADVTLEWAQETMIERMSSACNTAIVSGVDVTLTDGNTYHFSLALEDQLNLLSLQGMLATGAEAVPYHADGEECRYYSAADFSLIAEAATFWKLYQESYFNSLRGYIRCMTTITEIRAVTYGMDIPETYQTDVLKQLMVQMGGS